MGAGSSSINRDNNKSSVPTVFWEEEDNDDTHTDDSDNEEDDYDNYYYNHYRSSYGQHPPRNRKPVFQFSDLLGKSEYICHTNPRIRPIFVRYLFSGNWILDLLRSSSTTYCKSVQGKIFEENTPFNVADSHPTFSFLQEHSPKDIDTILLLTLAVALQVFGRSELFLHLSEHQWSEDCVRSVQWQDYSSFGRANMRQHFLAGESHGSPQYLCCLRTIALLDALYVHLVMKHSQTSICEYLQQVDIRHLWQEIFPIALSSLPFQMAVYEASPAACTHPEKEKCHNNCPAKSELSWTCTSMKNVDDLSYNKGKLHNNPKKSFPKLPSSSPLAMKHINSVTSATIVCQQNHMEDLFPVHSLSPRLQSIKRKQLLLQRARQHWTVTCVTPVLQRCPLFSFNREANTWCEVHPQHAFDWKLKRWVWTRIQVTERQQQKQQQSQNEMRDGVNDGAKDENESTIVTPEEKLWKMMSVQATVDICFLLAQVVG